MRSLCPEA